MRLRELFSGQLLVALIAAPGLWFPGAALAIQVTGEAYSADDGDLLYRELHDYQLDDDSGEVIYQRPGGEVIAIKALDFTSGRITPGYEVRYAQRDKRHGARVDDQQLALFHQREDQPLEREQIQAEKPLVVDAGFDPFVREHWQALTNGERLPFTFSFSKRLTTVGLRIEQVPAQRAPFSVQDNWRVFRIESQSALWRLFMTPIYLAYDSERRLQVYRGISNIEIAPGRTPVVEIRYQWPDEPGNQTADALAGG